jgi:hypothetical protein
MAESPSENGQVQEHKRTSSSPVGKPLPDTLHDEATPDEEDDRERWIF